MQLAREIVAIVTDQPPNAVEIRYVTEAIGRGWTKLDLIDRAQRSTDAEHPRQYLQTCLRSLAQTPCDRPVDHSLCCDYAGVIETPDGMAQCPGR